MKKKYTEFIPLTIAVLSVSDTRTDETDKSGYLLADKLVTSGHILGEKKILPDNIYQLRAIVSTWIADSNIQVILITGGTGFSPRDVTPQAIAPLLDTSIDGFGELFRKLSFAEIGVSTLQSRAMAGIANQTLIFCIPGSTNACVTAWNKILAEQLDCRTLPCNFAELLLTTN